jgi:hypothetical protein
MDHPRTLRAATGGTAPTDGVIDDVKKLDCFTRSSSDKSTTKEFGISGE